MFIVVLPRYCTLLCVSPLDCTLHYLFDCTLLVTLQPHTVPTFSTQLQGCFPFYSINPLFNVTFSYLTGLNQCIIILAIHSQIVLSLYASNQFIFSFRLRFSSLLVPSTHPPNNRPPPPDLFRSKSFLKDENNFYTQILYFRHPLTYVPDLHPRVSFQFSLSSKTS